MKYSISIFLVITFILAACTSAPQATMTPEATVTSTPLPSETPEPTPTPEPTLPAEVRGKFNEAGIDINKVQDATIDETGLHIKTPQTDSGGVPIIVDFTIEQLENSTVEGDKLVIYDESERKWILSQDLLFKTYFETELEIMTSEEKISNSPQELSGYKISSVSQLEGQLVIYRDNNNNGILTYNLLTGEVKDLPSAGIIELDLVSGEKLELAYFSDGQEAVDYIVEQGGHGSTYEMFSNQEDALIRWAHKYSQKYVVQKYGDSSININIYNEKTGFGEGTIGVSIGGVPELNGSVVLYLGSDDEIHTIFIGMDPKTIESKIRNREMMVRT